MKKPFRSKGEIRSLVSSSAKALALTCATIVLLFTGCSSAPKKPRIAVGSTVAVVISTEDVLYRADVVNEGGVKGTANRMLKETLRAMDERGIKGSSEAGKGQPKLSVELTTIETVTKHKPDPFFSTIVRQDVKIIFYAKLVSADGTTLFTVDGRKADESIDGVIKVIGKYLAKQVAKHYD